MGASPPGEFDVVRRCGSRLATAVSVPEVLGALALSVVEATGSPDCGVYLRDDRRVLTLQAAHGPQGPRHVNPEKPVEITIGWGVIGACAREAKPILVRDTDLDPRYAAGGQRRLSELAVPIIDGGGLIGVINCEHPEVGFFGEHHADILSALAAMAAGRVRGALKEQDLRRTLARLERTERELIVAAGQDELTGLQNRSSFEQEVRRSEEMGEGAMLALLDIDRFKTLNDTLGHRLGDDVIRAFAEVLREMTPPGGVAARIGGDEFAVLLTKPDLMTAHAWAESLRAAIKGGALGESGAGREVTLSIGVAPLGPGTWDHADEALYLAKESGRDRTEVYNPDDPRLAERSDAREWARRLARASGDGHLVLARQAVAPLGADEPPVGEFLLRYDDGRMITPDRFLPAAERFGLMRDLDRWVLDSACATLAQESDSRGCVNVSVPFALSGQFVAAVKAALKRTDVDPGRLTLEVTETAAIMDPGALAPALADLRAYGCRIAIDDFGSGWSSLDLVRALPVDILKIDGRWVTAAPGDELCCSVVRSVTEIAHLIDAKVVADWVERRETADFLTECGVDYAQGFLFGAPEVIGAPVISSGGLIRL